MNRKIAKNGMLAAALSIMAFLVPAPESRAQVDQCAECLNGALAVYTLCLQYTCSLDPNCGATCAAQYHQYEQYCRANFCS
jgi:hypothetical protein